MIIYTDGSAHPNPGPGGFGVVILDDNENLISTYKEQNDSTTNNRMELSAILWAFFKYGVPVAAGIEPPIVYSDSAYCVNTFNNWMFSWAKNNWIKSDKKKPENLDLIQLYYRYYQKGYRINLQKVKGHAKNKGNILADALATGEISKDEVKKLYGKNL